jgi:hypothetical protein
MITIYDLGEKFWLKTLNFPISVDNNVIRSTSTSVSESEFSNYETKNKFYFNQAIPI